MRDEQREIDGRGGPQMHVLLDARQRQQIVDEARHPLRLLAHDAEEFVARVTASSRAGPCKRLDKTEQRGERRAQLVAGVGDEVDAHALDAPRFGQIAQAHDGGRLEPFDLHRRDMRFKPAFHRQTFDPDGLLRLAAGEHARHASSMSGERRLRESGSP